MDEIMKGKITVLSPVHIGSGRGDLIYDYDFIRDGQVIRVIDQEKMFSTASEEAWAGHDVDVRISQLLKPEQYSSCSLYSLNHHGSSLNSMMEHIKNAHHCPYIPGSSLKGAIRTALAWSMVSDGTVQVRVQDMGSNRGSAAKRIEGQVFGTNPNRDIMRALQVADTSGVAAEEQLSLSRVVLYTIKGRGDRSQLVRKGERFEFDVESFSVGAELDCSVKLDSYLLREGVAQRLGFGEKKEWLVKFPEHCNAFAEKRIDHELEFYSYFSREVPHVVDFYRKLNELMKSVDRRRQFLLQVAWGAGWSAKTVGEGLDDDTWWAVRDKFKLGRLECGDFPKTRRIVERGKVPEMPLGWIQVDLT